MPIYQDVLPLDQMKKLAANSRCGDCGGVLTVAWSPERNQYMLRCGNDITHDTTAKVDLSGYYNEMKSKMGWRDKSLAQQVGNKAELILRPYETLPRLTEKQATDVVITLWPDAPKAEIMKAVMVCTQYGLNPLMKHIFLIPFKNRETGEKTYEMVLGIKATRIIASKSGRYSYVDGTPRLMTPDEQTRIYGDIDPNNIWAVTKLKDKEGNIFPGYGSWPKAAPVKGAEKGNTKANMAMIRSERQALDKMCPGQLPRDAGTVDEQYADRPAPTVKVESVPERVVNTQTGEITEGEFEETTAPTETPDETFDAMPSASIEAVRASAEPTATAQEAVKSSTAAQASEAVVLSPNERMNLLRADMAKINLKETTAIGYLSNKLKVVGILAGDNFDTAFSKATIEQQKSFRNYVTGQIKLI